MAYDRTQTGAGWLVSDIQAPVPDISGILSNDMPISEATTATPGAVAKATRPDHRHPRLTSVQRVTLDANGLAIVTYTRTFTAKPGVVLTAINPSGRTVFLEVVSDTQSGGLYTGCTVKGVRSAQIAGLGSIVLLTTLITALTTYDPTGAPASGVEVSVIAIQPS